MRNDDCGAVLPLLPDWIRGEWEADEARLVGTHLDACADCRAEAELLRDLAGTRPEPPADLAARIKGALREAGARPAPSPGWLPWRWTAFVPRVAAAAAVVVLAASALLMPGGEEPDVDPEGVELAFDAVPEVWLSGDGVVAGAPLLADLSDEELESLLEEMEP